tara:strand:+ start:175 stop:369 length:195 start_codon:yes stop_codon:yes gene_type:complete
MKIDITEEELFDLIEALENRIEWNRYSIPLYEKLCSYQKPLDLSKQNFDYEIPGFNPKVMKEKK